MRKGLFRAGICLLSAVLCGSLLHVSAFDVPELTKETAAAGTEAITIKAEQISSGNFKDTRYNNPVSPDFFCADPTTVEYNGRLYLYGTNDHEQFLAAGPDKDNTYEKIKSFLVFSTDDMVNWVYHGEINVGKIAPWIINSWAPSIVSREESDGKTHFYMYFSNSGAGTGVITSTDPVTGWTDPLGKPLISSNTPGLQNCPNPFDPGAVIDENGVGWLAFGGGDQTAYMPGTARIVQLGDDMISFASDFREIPAPYFFEANELNYINGTYVYTYCSNWANHAEQWDYDCPAPGGCGMVYMTSETPLDPESWVMQGECFRQPGECGFDYSNNHTHMHKYKGQWYMFYHTLALKHGMGITGSYRSMGVDPIEVDETAVRITRTGPTNRGAKIIAPVDPFDTNAAAELNGTADITYDLRDPQNPLVQSARAGAWFSVRDVQFTAGSTDNTADAAEQTQMNLDSLVYNITVKSIDRAATVTMHPADSSGDNCDGSVQIDGAGSYRISCDLGGTKGLMNVGYFEASDDAKITFVVDSITVNGKYTVDISAELTNTREWADGLRNIWNGFTDGDTVYTGEGTSFRYVGADDLIAFYASAAASAAADAPLLDVPLCLLARIMGKGTVEVHLDAPDGTVLARIGADSADAYQTVYTESVAAVGGTHDLYFVFSDADMSMQAWRFVRDGNAAASRKGDVNADGTVDPADTVMLQKWLLTDGSLTDANAADLDENGRINAVDLSLLKRMLLS